MAVLTMSAPVPTMRELVRRYLEHRCQFGYRLAARAMPIRIRSLC
jgi:hypothetical protein